MEHRSDPAALDEALARILSEPSRAQLLGLATARALENDAFIVVDGWQLTDAINTAMAEVLIGLPGIVAAEATTRLHQALPRSRARETAGEYALRLRAVAKEL